MTHCHVSQFVSDEARSTASIALWATVAGDSVKDVHEEHRDRDEGWLRGITGASFVEDALRLTEDGNSEQGDTDAP